MKVGIDVRALQFSGAARGTGRYLLDLLAGLAQHTDGGQFTLIHFSRVGLPPELDEAAPNMERFGVDYPPTTFDEYPWYQKHPRMRDLPVLPGMHRRAYLRGQVEAFGKAVSSLKLNLLHITAPFDVHFAPFQAPPAKTVSTFLDAIPLVFRDRYFDRWTPDQRSLFDLQRQALSAADYVVAISQASLRDAIRLYGVSEARSSAVYCAVSGAHGTAVDPGEIEAVLRGFHVKGPYFLFTSVADWHKGIDRIIPAFAEFRERLCRPFQLAVVGFQQPAERSLIRELAFDNGLNGRDVVVTGHVSDSEYLALMQGATALVCPSRYEGFGLPAAQAMKNGIPVLASTAASLPEVVGDAGICVDPEDEAAISETMMRLATDAGLRSSLSAKGVARAAQFTIEREGQEMMEVYRRALG